MKMIKVEINELTVELPGKCIVCPRCNGSGSHVNPAIDGHGLSSEDFAEDPDFEEAYFSGRYDVRCEECHGNNVIEIVDEEACKRKLSWWKGMLRHIREENARREYERESAYERRMGY